MAVQTYRIEIIHRLAKFSLHNKTFRDHFQTRNEAEEWYSHVVETQITDSAPADVLFTVFMDSQWRLLSERYVCHPVRT